MSYKVDLHTHSYGSPDGGLRVRDYRYFLENKLLDYIAITDHDSIETAVKIKAELGELGGRIIVGEEITTTKGELIGLYLTKPIKSGQSAVVTAREIKAQGGLVYVPHPFRKVRHGLSDQNLTEISSDVDIIEAYNGRSLLHQYASAAFGWAHPYWPYVAVASSSDAHGRFGWGRDYSLITASPTPGTLVSQLAHAEFSKRTVGFGVLYPKLNRLKKAVR